MTSRFFKRLICGLAMTTTLFSLSLKAQQKSVQLANTQQFTLHSEAVNDDFEIMVGLPFGYSGSDTRYKVLYVLDANVTFGMVHDIQTLLSFEPENPPMIVVGIGYKDFSNWIQKRARDYMGNEVSTVPGSGGAGKFLRFLEKQLIPHIDKEYRTTDSRLLYGHSTAGLFGLYTIFHSPDLFEGYIITSPSVDEDNDFTMRKMTLSSIVPSNPIKVYTSYGSREKTSFQTAYQQFIKKFKNQGKRNIQIRSEEIEASHMSSMAPALIRGLEYVNGTH